MIKNIAKSERIHIQILEWTYRQISLSFERHNIFLYIPKVESIWIFFVDTVENLAFKVAPCNRSSSAIGSAVNRHVR